MRSWAAAVVVALGLAGCGKLVNETAPPVAHGAGGAAGSGSGGASGAYTLFPVSGGRDGGLGPGVPPPRPVYTRDCIAARLALAGADASTADASAPALDASAPRIGRDGAVDLKLGGGDLTLLVVFDKSGSMAQGWDERTKWQAANESLTKAITPVLDNLTIGAIFFPQPDGCDVAPLETPPQMSYAPGPSFASRWKETESTRSPQGSTPLELAFLRADMAIERACGLGLLDDRFRVVLLTDGEPTCGDDTNAVVALAAEWNRLGVETWVMGLPGSSGATELLDAIARAGATGQAQMLGTPSALDQGLAAAVK